MVNGMIILDKPKYTHFSTYLNLYTDMVYHGLSSKGNWGAHYVFTSLFSDCRIWMLGSAIQIGHGHGPWLPDTLPKLVCVVD